MRVRFLRNWMAFKEGQEVELGSGVCETLKTRKIVVSAEGKAVKGPPEDKARRPRENK